VKRLVLILMISMPVLMLANGAEVYAAGIESLVMPGKLIQGHAKYESECSRCHRPFSKGSQNMLGFHGRTGAGKEQCSSCHDDHEGRDAIVVQFSRETFDHEQTDYALKGAHAGTDCVACHAIGKKYRAAEHRCISCHGTDDIHRENLVASMARWPATVVMLTNSMRIRLQSVMPATVSTMCMQDVMARGVPTVIAKKAGSASASITTRTPIIH
jgi:hypothetical protein